MRLYWTDWVRLSISFVLLVLALVGTYAWVGCPGIGATRCPTVPGNVALWAGVFGLFVLGRIYPLQLILVKLKPRQASEAEQQNPPADVQPRSKFWLETVRTMIYWLIVTAGVALTITVSRTGIVEPIMKIASGAFGATVLLAILYIFILVSAVEGEELTRIKLNTRLEHLQNLFFNLALDTFIGGMIALTIAMITD